MSIPRKGTELVAFSENLVAKITENAEAWEIPQAEIDELATASSQFQTLQMQCETPARTSVLVAQKNEAQNALLALLKPMINFRLQNPTITDDQRVSMGLTVRDSTKTPVPVPTTRPLFEVKVKDVRRLSVTFSDSDSGSKTRPYGINGAVVNYAVSDVPITDTTLLSHSALATRSPHTLEFADADRGRTVYLALQWQNNKGQKGPMSDIGNAIVP